jgi:hypothetical protein
MDFLDFLNHREGGMVFLLSPFQCTETETVETLGGCVSLKKYKSQGKL